MKQPCPGLSLGVTPGGIDVIRLHYSADPELTPERLTALRRLYSTDAYWRKEMEMDADALDGALVYPEFSSAVHVIQDNQVPARGCRFMSIDPHPRTPHAFLWALVDRWNDVYIYRELWPSVLYGLPGKLDDQTNENFYTIREYAESVAILEGNKLVWHRAEEAREYGSYERSRSGEKILWRTMDQAGKGFKAGDEAALLESYAKRYVRFGIRCIDPKKSHHTGEDAIRQLLKPRRHDVKGTWPRLHIAESCRELIYEFAHHRYQATKTPSDERDLKQDASAARSHQLDNLRYLATGNLYFSHKNES